MSSSLRVARRSVRALAGLVMLMAFALPVGAQEAPVGAWEVRVPGGKVLPTGAQRNAIAEANLTAAQVSYVTTPAVAITATLGWARSRDVASPGDPRLDLFSYDVGAELRGNAVAVRGRLRFRPFAGVGIGGRSYNYRSLAVDATHNAAGYGSVGTDIGYRRLRLRIEARDYVTGYAPLHGRGSSAVRNDVMVLVGVGIARR